MSQLHTLGEIRQSDKVLKSRPELRDLYSLVTPHYAAHWKAIGIQLGLLEGRLNSIELGYPTNVPWCCNKMFEELLKVNTTVTWEKVLSAIDSTATLCTLDSAKFMRQLSDHVKENYISTRYLTQEALWKHLCPKHFVNVLLIHHMEENREKEIANIASLMREGLTGGSLLLHFNRPTSDQVQINSYTTTCISDIFQPIKDNRGNIAPPPPQVIIIDGAPGMGKTTLSKEIAYRWAKSELLSDTELLFFVYLRDPEIQKMHDFQSFIHYFYNFDDAAAELSKQCAEILIKRSNDDIAIILDGYDECLNISDDQFITRIINRKVFPKSKLIITSWLTATDALQHIGDIRVEVMGFTDDSKKEYIEQELKDDHNKIDKLCSYLANNSTINSICYIPMIMTILVCLFKETEELPSDHTELYKNFITYAISRYVESPGCPRPKILRLEKLPETYKQYMTEFSKFAFETLKSNSIVFNEEDIQSLCPELSSANNDFQGLGLLKSTQYFSMKKIDNCVLYNFLHLSIQEYLAACYISSLNPSNQFELLKSTLFAEKYLNTWVMFACLNKSTMLKVYNYLIYMESPDVKLKSRLDLADQCDPVRTFSTLVEHYIVNHFTNRMQVFCFGDRKVMLDDENEISKLAFDKSYLSIYHVSKAANQIMEMFVVNKNTQEDLYENVESVLKSNNQLSVTIVSTSSFTGYRATTQQLCDGFKINNKVTDSILLRNSFIGDDIAKAISFCITNSTMKLVLFDSCIISYAGSKLILDAMSTLTSLQVVSFNNVPLNEGIAEAMKCVITNAIELLVVQLSNCNIQKLVATIVSALKQISTLTVLDLARNALNHGVFDELSTVIRANNKLQKLWLAKTDLRHHSIGIMYALSEITSLTELDLSENYMPKEVATSLAAAINSNCSLETLLLSNNNLGTNGINTIARSLSNLPNLRVLHVGNNNLTWEAADAIASVVLNNIHLQILDLHSNFLGIGVRKIAKAVKNISTLKQLNLNNNQIPECVAEDLASATLNNSLLETFVVGNNFLKAKGVKTIAQALSSKKSLKLLNLYNNQATEEAAEAIGLVISNNSGLKGLYLGNNKLGNGVGKILAALSCISTLETLDLSRNDISAEMATELATVIERNPSLVDLRLNGNRLMSSGIITVAKSLSNISTLRKLNIGNNLITKEAVAAIRLVLTDNKGLEELHLGYNQLGLDMKNLITYFKGTTFSKALMLSKHDDKLDVLVDNGLSSIPSDGSCSLDKLSLANNDLRIYGATILQSFCMITTLTEMNLSGNFMPQEVAVDLAALIRNNHSLKVLDLSDNKLHTNGAVTVLQSLIELSTLKVLNFANNKITHKAADAIASVIVHNVKMEKLLLQSNFLGAGVKQIANALKNISSLKKLILNNNYIPESVAEDIAGAILSNDSLCVLELMGNALKASGIVKISQALCNIKTVKLLNIAANKITEEATDAVSLAISSNSELEELNLCNNKLKVGALKVLAALKNLSTLKVLNLTKNDMSAEVSTELASVIASNSSLEDLGLSGNWLTTNGIILIMKSLNEVMTLKRLSIQHNLITEEAVDSIASLFTRNSALQELYLGHNSLNLSIMKILELGSSLRLLDVDSNISGIITDGLPTVIGCNNLQKLWLAFNDLRTCGDYLVEVFSSLTQLTELNLTGNNLPREAAMPLATFINNNCSLGTLLLSNNNLQTSGVVTIAQPLSQLSTLKRLHIGNNGITHEAADSIASVMLNNIHLEELYLQDNLLGTGVEQIASALKHLFKLRHLNLNTNQIPESAAESLACAISSLRSLQAIYLSNNNFNNSGIIKLVHALSSLKSLEIIAFHGNRCAEETADAIGLAISNNSGLEQLFLGNNKLRTGALKIVVALKNISTLTILDLTNNDVSVEVATELACAISMNSYLADVKLGGNRLTTNGIVIITDSLRNVLALKKLDVSNNLITEEAASVIALLLADSCELEELYIGNNSVREGLSKILAPLEDNRSLKSLKINNNGSSVTATLTIGSSNQLQSLYLSNNDLRSCERIILRALIKITTLTELNLFGNNIPEEAAGDLAAVITDNCFLKILNLFGNSLHTGGVITISQSLNNIATLKVLNIGNNEVSHQAASAISSVIRNNIDLEELNLSYNILGSGAREIAIPLKCISNLRLINLSNNDIPESVAEDLAGALVQNNSLRFIRLMNNGFRTGGAVSIFHAISRLHEVEVLNFYNNQIGEEAADAIAAAVLNNVKLKELFLGCNKLRMGVLKILSALKNITTLKELELTNNGIPHAVATELAYTITSNSFIENLQLSDNSFSTSGIIAIAKSLCNVSTLRVLEIQNNLITKDAAVALSSVILNNVHLQTLNLNGNFLGEGINQIASALVTVSNLQDLHLNNNQIPECVAEDLAGAILNCKSLQVFSFGGNNLNTNGLIILLQVLAEIKSLKFLNLQNNSITKEVGDYIAPVLSRNHGLKELYLGNNYLGPGIMKVAAGFKNIPLLETLDLCDNFMSEVEATELADAITDNDCLEALVLGDNWLTTNGMIAIAGSLKALSNLTCVYFHNTSLTEEAADAISLVILNNVHLETLALQNNFLERGVRQIANALKNISNLKCLYLDNNCIQESAAEDLAGAISNNMFLEVIGLSGNDFQTNGIIAIFEALSKIETLKFLNFNNNHATEEVADSIALAISSNCGLQQLHLGYNSLGPGALKILAALKSISSLMVLDLSDNDMSDEVALVLASAIVSNCSLVHLKLSDNRLTNNGIMIIANSLSSTPTFECLDICNNLLTEDIMDVLTLLMSSNPDTEIIV